MAEYIERRTAIEHLNVWCDGCGSAAECILSESAADVAPVVRCKDCYQSVVIGNVLHCTYWSKDTDENGYCHEGG